MNDALKKDKTSPDADSGLDMFVTREKEDAELVTGIFYQRDDIKELAERLQMMVVGGDKRYTQAQAVTLAQAALLHGLSPFNGEIWLLVDGDGYSIGLMIGIKGLRKHAHRQVRRDRTRYSISTTQVTDPDELEVLAPQSIYSDKVLVYKSTLTVDAKTGQWLVDFAKLTHAGIDSAEAVAISGDRPVTVGYGIYDRQLEKYQWRFGRQSPAQIAQKRAEADVLKKEFDVLFSMEYSDELPRYFGSDISQLGPDWDNLGQPSFEMPEEKKETQLRVPKTEKELMDELQVKS